ncbi:MAG: type II CRISPR RNA-guided endonuclease Cas9 [Phycisphaerales bacterium]
MLGLDIGTNSVGWAVLGLSGQGQPDSIIACGSRVFEAGVDGTSDQIAVGKDAPRGVERRLARLQRRQTLRRARRRRKIFRLLMTNGLLPSIESTSPAAIHACIEQLDAALRTTWLQPGDHRGQLVFPYLLRAAAANKSLPLHELGRALYHLAHRRGFLSNRKTRAKEDDEGKVKQGISELRAAMKAAGAATLGAYFATLEPRNGRIRARYTDRSMYLEEFDAIQRANPQVAVEAWQALHKAFFFQRKLKSAKHLIGKCSCLPRQRRASMWHPVYQRFRLLEQVNNLRVHNPETREDRGLTDAERATLVDALGKQESMTAGGVKKLLKLRGCELSIEHVGSGKLIGDRTAAAMRRVFGDRWDSMSESDRMQVLLDVHSYEHADALKRRGASHWKLEPEQAAALADASLEPGYASLSVRAMSQLMPHLERGLNSREALDVAFPGRFSAGTAVDRLPPVRTAMGDLRNPTVNRSLTEVRRVVNRIIDKWGKPKLVRLELGRDLKRGRRERESLAKDNREQEKRRENAAAAIIAEAGVPAPRRSDIEKMLLAEECGMTCPYTGRRFGMADLFGKTPTVDVEHIIPYSRSLDDSFSNKTLCFVEENRNVKRQRTPHEAYSTDAARWEQMLDRVRRFKGRHARAKLERFEMSNVGEELLEEFTSRQLNDTRYASRLAGQFVGQLFGGSVDADSVRRVQVSTGTVTARLRQAWRMGLALHDDGKKNRADHRHHALDAIAVALSSPALVKRMADAAVRGAAAGRDGKLLQFSEPWPQFLEHVKAAIEPIIVSHRVDRRLAGPLHEDTLYSRPLQVAGKSVFRVRKGIESITASTLAELPDPVLRDTISNALKSEPSAKPFATPALHPVARSQGQTIERVRRLRVGASRTPVLLETAHATRWVAPGSNHHMAVYAVTDAKGTRWEAEVVTRLEAHRRKMRGEAIVRTIREDGAKLVFTLRSGDIIRVPAEDGAAVFHVIGSASGDTVETKPVHDARPAGEIRKVGKAGGRAVWSVTKLQRSGAVKVDIGVLGEVTLNRE